MQTIFILLAPSSSLGHRRLSLGPRITFSRSNPPVLPRDRSIPLSPQSVAVLNVDKLSVFESRKQLKKLAHVLPRSEPVSDEHPLLGETSNALRDLGLHTMELSLQVSHVFHLAHPSRRVVDHLRRGGKRGCINLTQRPAQVRERDSARGEQRAPEFVKARRTNNLAMESLFLFCLGRPVAKHWII